jgi:type IV pilus assembly protein PilM
MNKDSFGLDIGATSIKLVWLENQKSGYLLKSAIIVPSPARGIASEAPLDQEEMAKAIQAAAAQANIETKNVNVALPENQVYTKVLEMPGLSERELASAIYWEAERHIPVPLSSITLAWTITKKPENLSANEKMEVLMVGAPTALINKYQKIVAMAGFNISNMETEILSTARSLVTGAAFPTTLIINIGAVTTSLAIVKDSVMIFTYTVAIGGAAINRAIATDLALTPEQAEEYKKAYGISDQTLGGKIGKAAEPILSSILAEVKKAISFYNQKYGNTDVIRQILLSGGTAKLPGIELYFAQNSGIETVTANPWKVLAPQEVPKDILDNAPDYSVAVGLAMKEYE